MNSWISPGKANEHDSGYWTMPFQKFAGPKDFHGVSPTDIFVFLDENAASIDEGWLYLCVTGYLTMSLSKVIASASVNLVTPFLGVVAFALLCRWMWKARIQSPLFLSWFILFATFGGWLMILLIALFWESSGMASLGFFYLVLVAPFVTAAVAWSLHRRC